jgi:RNA polymerase sigma-70 factor, ECF subfamily
MAEVGRQQRFERVYDEHFDRVGAYLLARSDRDSAADALARTFEIAWRRQASMPADPLPWLLGVARRVLADGRRAQRRHDALIDRIATTVNETGEDHADTLAQRERALHALAGLTAAQREALLLVAWDGLTQRQAAAVMGCSRGALAVRVHRARRQLQAALPPAASGSQHMSAAQSDSSRSNQIYPSPKEAI